MTEISPSNTAACGIRAWRSERAASRHAFTTALGVTLSSAAGFASPVMAQDSPAVVELDPITVEGEDGEGQVNVGESADSRFTAPLVDTPKTVTVIPAIVLEQRGVVSLEDIFRTTPGISMASGEGGTPDGDRPLIRGSNAENSVLVDGLRDPGAQSRGTFNLEQVEIIKGADSVYSGRGGAGGSVNLVTKTAKDYDFNRSTLTFGTENTIGASIDSNFVITETVAARINLMRRDGGVAGRDAVEESVFGGAATITFGMGTGFRKTFSVSHYESDGIPDYGIPWIAGTTELADVDYDNFYGLANRDFQTSKNDSLTARFEYDIAPNLMLSNTTRFTRASLHYIVSNPDDSRGNVANGYVWRSPKSRGSETESWYNQTELSGQAMTGRLDHNFVVGVEASKEDSYNAGYTVESGSSTCDASTVGAPSNYNCTTLDNPNPYDPWVGTITRSTAATIGKAETLSVYAFDTIKFNEQWQANLGLRYDSFKVERETSGGRGGPYVGSDESEFVTFQAGLVYKPRPNGSIYLSFGTAAEPAGLSNGEGGDNLSESVEDLDPVQTTSIELGTKWDLYDGRLSVSAALFQNATDNARVTVDGETLNLGKNRVRGVELQVAGHLTEAWSVFGGFTYLDPVVVDDGDGDNAGNVFPNTPKESFSLWTTYALNDRLTLGGGATYKGAQYADAANTRKLPGYWRFDAMAQYKLTENASLRLIGNNLADNRYVERSYTTHYATVAPGRSFTLTANLDF